ncbi:hypothetical protein [Streptomyces sp. NPDC002491]
MRTRRAAATALVQGTLRAPARTGTREASRLLDSPRADLLAIRGAHHGAGGRDLAEDAGRPPTLHGKIDSAATADRTAARGAGAGRIP